MDLSLSEIISVICATVSLIATTVIGCFQIWQNKNMKRFEERQDKRDEARRCEELDAAVIKFMSSHADERLLLPLCCVATAYDKYRNYHRELYTDFCSQTKEVQSAILKAASLDLVSLYDENLFNTCIAKVDALQKERCKGVFNVFYDNGKYVKRAIVSYGDKLIPCHNIIYSPPDKTMFQSFVPDDRHLYSECITDVLLDLRGDRADFGDTDLRTVLRSVYHLGTCDEIEMCEYVCYSAQCISAYFSDKSVSDVRNFGCIEDFDSSKLTMEDLFLITLFEIWSNLLDEGEEE